MTIPASIAFQGGGALGIAHLGAWQRLNERFTIASTAGTSAGAIVAAHCAAGYDPAHVIEIFESLDWQTMVVRQSWLKLFTRMDAWSDGEAFYQWLLARMVARFPGVPARDVTFQRLYERTRISLAIVACDLNTPEPKPVVFSVEAEPQTTVAFAVRASISIPGYFATVPRRDRGQELVDGGVLLNFPARLLQPAATAADRPLIGVRFTQPLAYLDRPRIWETINRTKDLLLAPGSGPSDELLNDPHYLDVVIDVAGFDALDFNLNTMQKRELVQRGRAAADRALLAYDLRLAQQATPNSSAIRTQAIHTVAQPPIQQVNTKPAQREAPRVPTEVRIENNAPSQGMQGVFHGPITIHHGGPSLPTPVQQEPSMSQNLEFTKLYPILVERYNLEELRTLCAQLLVTFDDLGGEGRQAKARELILWLQRRGRIADLNALLATESTPPSTMGKELQPSANIDLAIVTAMPEELEPVLALIGGRAHWQPILLDNFVHYRGQFDFEGCSLRVVACALWKYGGNPTTAEILRLKALHPRMIAMTGICAGWESKDIHFGDVIIADQAFHAGEGKQTIHGFEPDIRTYQPPPWLLQWLGDFSSDKQWFTGMQSPRPYSLRYQADWLLCQMKERGITFPENDADQRKVKASRIDYPRTRQLLVDNGLLSAEGVLTEQALIHLNKLSQKNHGKLAPIRDPKQPTAHYGTFASTEAVIAVENPFLEHAQRIRKVRAIELEVASLFAAAMEIGVPAFAVKGVSDYGTPTKDDAFHTYAAEASARWMYQFLQRYGHLLAKI